MEKRRELIVRVEKLLIADLLKDVRDLIEQASDDDLETLAKELEQELFQPHDRAAKAEAMPKPEGPVQPPGITEVKWR